MKLGIIVSELESILTADAMKHTFNLTTMGGRQAVFASYAVTNASQFAMIFVAYLTTFLVIT